MTRQIGPRRKFLKLICGKLTVCCFLLWLSWWWACLSWDLRADYFLNLFIYFTQIVSYTLHMYTSTSCIRFVGNRPPFTKIFKLFNCAFDWQLWIAVFFVNDCLSEVDSPSNPGIGGLERFHLDFWEWVVPRQVLYQFSAPREVRGLVSPDLGPSRPVFVMNDITTTALPSSASPSLFEFEI